MSYKTWLDDRIHYDIPIKSFASVMTKSLEISLSATELKYGCSEHTDTHQVYKISPSLTSLDWSTYYSVDPSTKILLASLFASKHPSFSAEQLLQLNNSLQIWKILLNL